MAEAAKAPQRPDPFCATVYVPVTRKVGDEATTVDILLHRGRDDSRSTWRGPLARSRFFFRPGVYPAVTIPGEATIVVVIPPDEGAPLAYYVD